MAAALEAGSEPPTALAEGNAAEQAGDRSVLTVQEDGSVTPEG